MRIPLHSKLTRAQYRDMRARHDLSTLRAVSTRGITAVDWTDSHQHEKFLAIYQREITRHEQHAG